MAGEYSYREAQTIPHQVIYIEKGILEEISNGKCVRTLQQGDIIGKRWLFFAGDKNQEFGDIRTRFDCPTSLRAYTNTSLIFGLSDSGQVQDLRSRFETDFAFLKIDRDSVHRKRQARVNWKRGYQKMATAIDGLSDRARDQIPSAAIADNTNVINSNLSSTPTRNTHPFPENDTDNHRKKE